jgi:predicted MPP superfamily phosphohydrolase
VTHDQRHWADGAVSLIKPLLKITGGVYCILGNHDGWPESVNPIFNTRFVSGRLSAAGFTCLVNECAHLAEVPEVAVVGVGSMSVSGADLESAAAGLPVSAPKILLAHEPDFADLVPEGYMIQISGHSHAGQVRIPGLPPLHCPQFGRKYPEGLQRAPHVTVYTNRGIGLIGPQVRVFCPPEITIFHCDAAA